MGVIEDLRVSLRAAMKARDRVAVSALRTALAAIENAEAPPIDTAAAEVRGALIDHARVELSIDDIVLVLRAQIGERTQAIATLTGRGQDGEIERLHQEIAVLQPFVP